MQKIWLLQPVIKGILTLATCNLQQVIWDLFYSNILWEEFQLLFSVLFLIIA